MTPLPAHNCILSTLAHRKHICRSELIKYEHLLIVQLALTAGPHAVPTSLSQQTAVQFRHFALPMGSGTGASEVSLGTVYAFFFSLPWLHNRTATLVEPCYLSSEPSCIKSSCIADLAVLNIEARHMPHTG